MVRLPGRCISFGTSAALVLGLSSTSHALKAVILADTNRDGRVDVLGTSDVDGKDTWTETRGALFLANIADTNQRCSSLITDATPDEHLDQCHDASDNIQRNPKYLAPLRTVPDPDLGTSAAATVTVSGPSGAREKVRVFHRVGDSWKFVGEDYTFGSADLRRGLMLGIDARDVRRPGGWDGRVTVHFNVTDDGETVSDGVSLRVAPVLTHHTLQDPDQVLTVTGTELGAPQGQFVDFVEGYADKAGVQKPVVKLDGIDIWAQDFLEPGYTSMPGPNGPVTLRIMIRSSQPHRAAGRQVFTELRSDTVGAVQHAATHLYEGFNTSPDSLGNLETIPPHTHNGRHYPAGRTIMGTRAGCQPNMVSFLRAQEVQDPIELDHDWLSVGHTDEYMQFVPANNSRGWVMAVHDPMAGLHLLQKAQADGHGQSPALSRPRFPYDTETSYCRLPRHTINQVLALADLEAITEHCARRIAHNVDIVKRETGISEDDMIRIPGLYYTAGSGLDCDDDDDTAEQPAAQTTTNKIPTILEAAAASASHAHPLRRAEPIQRVAALYPATINGILFANREYLAPNPWGPVINGQDILAAAVARAYALADVRVTFMDDWFDHHRRGGETHCGTNVIRDASKPWW